MCTDADARASGFFKKAIIRHKDGPSAYKFVNKNIMPLNSLFKKLGN